MFKFGFDIAEIFYHKVVCTVCISRLGICSSLKIAHCNDQLWVIRSDRSWQKSNRERIAQVAQDKRATISDLLRLLMTKEQRERFTQVAHQKWAKEWIAHLLCGNRSFAKKNKQLAQKKFFLQIVNIIYKYYIFII